MNANATQILAELRRLADTRGWAPVIASIEAIGAADPQRVLVAAVNGSDPSLFQRWIDRISPDTKVETVSLEALEENPLPALTAGRVVAFLECGRLIEAQAVAALSVAVLSRPRE